MRASKSIPIIVAENIKQKRKALKMTQGELAELLGYSPKAISKWESGTGTPPTVILPELARVLQTNVESLY